MGILSRLFRREGAGRTQDDRQVAEMVERVIHLSPRLRLAPRYQPRLEAAIGKGLEYLSGLLASPAEVHDASPAAWASDPYVRAFFASPDDVSPVLSRSADLRAFFEREPGLHEAYGVLGMAMEERRTLGVAQEGGTTRHDVQQTTLSFSDHQVRICAADEAALNAEIIRRMVDQLAIEGLARVAADTSRREVLEQERKLLLTRLRLLERQGAGMRSVVGSDAGADAGEQARLRQQMEDNDRELDSLGSRTEALDRQLEGVCEVFADPVPLLHVSSRPLRLSRMNVVLDDACRRRGGPRRAGHCPRPRRPAPRARIRADALFAHTSASAQEPAGRGRPAALAG